MLSVVIPAYNEAEMLGETAGVLRDILTAAAIDYQLIFVDDGSKDGTWAEIEAARQKDAKVEGISFSRNFGKEAAIMAGLAQAKGACCVVIDCDLQHPPEKIPEMYALWQQGYMVVEGIKSDRGSESGFHRLAARIFYGIITWLTKLDMNKTSDYKLLDAEVVRAILGMKERHPFFRALSAWVGFPSTSVVYQVQPRKKGQSKWAFFSLFKYAIANIATFSTAPMQIITVAGVVVILLSVIMGVQTLVRWASGTAVEGFTTVILLLLIIGGIVMLSLGIIGYYISHIYDEIKGRPSYIVQRRTGPAPAGESPQKSANANANKE